MIISFFINIALLIAKLIIKYIIIILIKQKYSQSTKPFSIIE